MRFSEASRRKVIDISTAEQVGEVDGLVVDAASATITALRLRGVRKGRGKGNLVDWSSLQAFGVDAVTLPGSDAIREPADERERQVAAGKLDVPGRLVLSDRGRALGKALDFDFDAGTGEVTLLVTETEEVDGGRLLGLGSYALVVRDED